VTRRTYVFRSNTISPLTVLGFTLLGVVVFFLALPLFLAALVVFGAVAAYLAWRVRKALRQLERESLRRRGQGGGPGVFPYIIDVTPESPDPLQGEDRGNRRISPDPQ